MDRQTEPANSDSSSARDGLLCAVLAYGMWGFMPIYFKLLDFVDPWEMLAHRIVWAIPLGAAVIALRRQWGEVAKAVFHRETLAMLITASLLIGANWMVYIYAVQRGEIFQASLGYYINPLMSVLAGVLVFGERLRPGQILALGFAAVGVGVLTLGRGEVPLLALALAVTFTVYGVIRKRVAVGAMPGLFIETLILFPGAAVIGFWLAASGQPDFGAGDPAVTGALLLAGPLSVLPLLFFALAAKRLPLSTMGFLQFVGPTIQFFIGLYYGEPFDSTIAVAFALIWFAVALFIGDAWRSARRRIPVNLR